MSGEPSSEPPIALLPAAGHGTRLGSIGHSKEIVPVGRRRGARTGESREQPVIGHLLERLGAAGIREAVIVLREGKGDVSEALADGSEWGMRLRYRTVPATPGVPWTLDRARDLVAGRRVALAFPDILFEPRDAFAALRERLAESEAELVLGLFPTDRPEKTDMVRLDGAGRPVELVIKQPDRGLRWTWSIALWKPAFTDFLHGWVRAHDRRGIGHERWVGDVVTSALEEGVSVDAVRFEGGRYLDVGTPEDLALARRLYAG